MCKNLNCAYKITAQPLRKVGITSSPQSSQTFAESPNQLLLDGGKNLNFFHYDPVRDTVRVVMDSSRIATKN